MRDLATRPHNYDVVTELASHSAHVSQKLQRLLNQNRPPVAVLPTQGVGVAALAPHVSAGVHNYEFVMALNTQLFSDLSNLPAVKLVQEINAQRMNALLDEINAKVRTFDLLQGIDKRLFNFEAFTKVDPALFGLESVSPEDATVRAAVVDFVEELSSEQGESYGDKASLAARWKQLSFQDKATWVLILVQFALMLFDRIAQTDFDVNFNPQFDFDFIFNPQIDIDFNFNNMVFPPPTETG